MLKYIEVHGCDNCPHKNHKINSFTKHSTITCSIRGFIINQYCYPNKLSFHPQCPLETLTTVNKRFMTHKYIIVQKETPELIVGNVEFHYQLTKYPSTQVITIITCSLVMIIMDGNQSHDNIKKYNGSITSMSK